MLEFISIPSQELCRILGAKKEELTPFELAFRTALESANSQDELNAMRERACLEEAVPVPIGPRGQRVRI